MQAVLGGAAFGIGVKYGGEKALPTYRRRPASDFLPSGMRPPPSRPGSVRCPAAGDSRKSGGGGARTGELGGISAGSSPDDGARPPSGFGR